MEKSIESNEKNENKEYDESILQRPINIGVKNVREILKCLQIGTKEIKDIILNECNLIYECKICNNLFRSLANLISHKRVYCQKHCCESMTLFSNVETDESTVIVLPEKPSDDDEDDDNEINKENEDEEKECSKEESVKDEEENIVTTIGNSSPKIFVPAKKESREEKLEKWEAKSSSASMDEEEPEKKNDDKILYLKPIEGNTNAVFQQLHDKNRKTVEENKPEKEAEPGKKLVVIIPKNVTNSSKSASTDGINYSRHKLLSGRSDCDTETLSCLICNTRYTSLKTLYLHMVNLHSHRRWYYPCPFCNTSFVQLWGVTRHLIKVHKKNKEQITKLRVVIKKRAFLKSFDKDVFEMNDSSHSPDKSFTFKSYEETGEVRQVLHKCSNCSRIFNHRSSVVNHEKFCAKKQNKPIVKTFINSHSSNDSSVVTRPKRFIEKKVNKDFINSQTLNWRSANKVNTNSSTKKCNSAANGKKLDSIINSKRLSCLKCHKKFCSLSNLKRHAAIHVGWTRYKCKYCSYRSYQKSECRTHIQKSHNITCTTSGLEKLIICLDKNNKKEKLNNKQAKNTENSCTKETRKKQGKYTVNSIDKGVNSLSVKTVDCPSNRKTDTDSGDKLLIPVAVPISSVAGGANVRQMSTRFSSRQIEDMDNPAKFFGTLVTRSGAYKKLNLLPNRDQSSS